MALVATVGASDANSYATVSEASAYFENRLHSDGWDSFADKDKALITATSMLDWYMTWKGTKTTELQSLDWPRTGATGQNSVAISSSIIPVNVKIATFELALSSLDEDRTEDWDLAGFKSLKVDVIEIEADDSSSNSKPSAIPQKVYSILRDLLQSSSGSSIRTAFLLRR